MFFSTLVANRSIYGGNEIILGIARTGAKYTPGNHKSNDNPIADAIERGDTIDLTWDGMIEEVMRLYRDYGVRYYHEHARNAVSREQTTSLETYKAFGRIVATHAPDAILSFGASRNGTEVADAIAKNGEWARIAQCEIPRTSGGADFVTAQAAVELQIIADMERQQYVHIGRHGEYQVLRDLSCYQPTSNYEEVMLDVHSTQGGRNYGKSSPAIQLATLKRVIEVRKQLGLPFEVEWVQGSRSELLTRYLANILQGGIRTIGRLNITVLFGFSPQLPFPQSYQEFQNVVNRAKSVANTDPAFGPCSPDAVDFGPLSVSVTVGAAVIPKQASTHIKAIDVGPLTGEVLGPMERLAAWSSMPDSGVDIFRVGIEDTPYVLDPAGRPLPATNLAIIDRAASIIGKAGGKIVTGKERLESFRSATQGTVS